MSPEAEREEPELSGRQTTCARAPLFAGSGARITRAESWRCVGNVACRELLSAGALVVWRESCPPCRSHARLSHKGGLSGSFNPGSCMKQLRPR